MLNNTASSRSAKPLSVLRQSPRSVRDKIAAGDLPALRIGAGPRAPIRIEAEELDAGSPPVT